MADLLGALRALSPKVTPTLGLDQWAGGGESSRFEGLRSKPAVEGSEDLTRILAIPRRAIVDLDGSAQALALIEYMTNKLTLGPKDCVCRSKFNRPCITRLKAAQAWALFEAPLVQGLLGCVGVGCFVYNTRITTDLGQVSIGDIVEKNVGTLALSYNTGTDCFEWKKIVRRLRKPGYGILVRLNHEQGSFICTEAHKIWVIGQGYVEASNLRAGNRLIYLNESGLKIESVVMTLDVLGSGGAENAVYDLEIEGNHNYAANNVIVSNSGKTMLNVLTPMVMPDCKHAVLLIPPGLREQLKAEYLMLREHFKVPTMIMDDKFVTAPITGAPVLHVVPYSKFNRPESTALLAMLNPDLIIADECHKLRYRNTSTTSRVLRRFVENPSTRFCGWSGTITGKSIRDFAHISAIALRESSPLPLDPATVEEWTVAIDPSDWPADAGALKQLCDPGEEMYSGFHRRLVETMGVVATKAGSIDASINITQRIPPPMPQRLRDILNNIREQEKRPDGEELVDILAIEKCARELACGFFYRWVFPHGEPESLIKEWFAARKTWGKELREQLKSRKEHMDSPKLCANAAKRAYQGDFGGEPYRGDLPTWAADSWKPWAAIKDKVYHESEVVGSNPTKRSGVL